ncbi:aminoglycoside phosphotransferase (APT) family kinase protein [Crossiella equi]|uniref:Aminoglycoside phosphotransferase (APT) family kinase protein n=1 Tax=Crossiella equi TaxID=130796 RepID=A0ABS5AKV1_9PSEU|nr:phosphotransferase [Crossiella equi]MBP2477196.1 aminoglycoside phosphotransferase (APT) family kinase protein [Crossiella equi]
MTGPGIDQGWDSHTALVEGRWIHRRPRRADVAVRLRRETTFLPWLADRLPLAVPRPELVRTDPLEVRHALVPGEGTEDPVAEHGAALGAFLRALHTTPVAAAVERGLTDGATARADLASAVEGFRSQVLPRLDASYRARGAELLEEVLAAPADTVVHGDLGPEHVLSEGSRLTGVIDFTDAHVGDAAVDLAWALYGTSAPCAAALAQAYGGVSADLRRRALAWHRLGPWFEVVHCLRLGRAEEVGSGLAGVRARLDEVG